MCRLAAGASAPSITLQNGFASNYLCMMRNIMRFVVERDLLAGEQEGNKLFGAAVIRKSDMSVVVADTNKETEWPLLHGEVSCLRFSAGLVACLDVLRFNFAQ